MSLTSLVEAAVSESFCKCQAGHGAHLKDRFSFLSSHDTCFNFPDKERRSGMIKIFAPTMA